MTVEAYLRSLVPGLELDDAVVERCARSPKEVGLEPLALNGDIDLLGRVQVEEEDDEEEVLPPQEEPSEETPEGSETEGGEPEEGDTDTETISGDEGESPEEEPDEPAEEEPEEDDIEDEYLFQMRLDYASSCIYYSVLGVFAGGGYTEQVGDVRVSRGGLTITMADRERYKMLGDALRRKYGWELLDDVSDDSGVFNASYLCNVWNM